MSVGAPETGRSGIADPPRPRVVEVPLPDSGLAESARFYRETFSIVSFDGSSSLPIDAADAPADHARPRARALRADPALRATTLAVVASPEPIPAAIVAPVAVPYREPLFARLVERGAVAPTVVYKSRTQASLDQPEGWFPSGHAYPTRVLDSFQHGRAGRTPVLFVRGLTRALDELDPHCVVSWEYGPATWQGLAWCRRRKRPLVIFSELTPATDRETSAVRRAVHRFCARRAAGFIVASSAGVERLASLGVARERVEVSLQMTDVASFRAAAATREPTPDGVVRVLTVGRLVPDKNLALLIEALADARLDPNGAELVLAGSGSLEGELRGLAERRGVRTRFVGHVAPADLPATFAAADVLAHVSTYEPFGVAVREGVAAGLPVICSSAVGAAGDFALEGRNAFVVDPNDRDAIANALRTLASDAPLRERMARESEAITAEHDPERDVEAFERAILRAVSG